MEQTLVNLPIDSSSITDADEEVHTSQAFVPALDSDMTQDLPALLAQPDENKSHRPGWTSWPGAHRFAERYPDNPV